MISLVVMNFNRADYLKKKILPHFEKMSVISEILVSHGKKENYFETGSEKIKHFQHWELNESYGLALRFFTASMAKNDCILIIDDDIFAPEDTICFLYRRWQKNPDTLHGIYGRNLDQNMEYNTTLVWGNCHIVLTRLMLVKRELCTLFINQMNSLQNELINKSKPFWNGEDITLSLLSIHTYGVFPIAYKLKHTNRLHVLELGNGISWQSTHLNYRKLLSSKMVEQLALKDKVNELPPSYKTGSNAWYEFWNSPFYWYFITAALIILYPLWKWLIN